MINGLLITNPAETDIKAVYKVFETSIPDAFEKEGLGSLKEDIYEQVIYKKHLFDTSLKLPNSDIYFLVAKLDETIVGTISFRPCGEDIKKCTKDEFSSIGELGTLYVLPSYQNQGVGSELISAMTTYLSEQGIEQFCLDSGFKHAQKRWLRKFGKPYKEVKDYWRSGDSLMIWLCRVSDFIKK
jgi:GNAT superfamily N-acetyltransferase